MKLAALKGGTRPLEVEFPGGEDGEDEVLHIEYRPGELTLEVAEQMQSAMANNKETDVAHILLSKVLVSWDLEEDEVDAEGNPTGETVPVPCDARGLRKIPLPALGQIMYAMTEDVRPNPPKDVTSEDTSPQEETSEKPLSGTVS